MPRRQLYLTASALLLAVLLVARWISQWGLVTIHAKDEPLGKVLASIASQGHVRIETSVDPTKTVTMNVDQVPVIEALDTLATVSESSWRAVCLAAPDKTALEAGISQLKAGGKLDGWTVAYYPGFGMGPMGPLSDRPIDPRTLEWKPEGPALDVEKLLDEAAQKTGVMAATPQEWVPVASRLPASGPVEGGVTGLIGSVRGKVGSFLFLTERGRRQGPPDAAPDTPSQPTARQDRPRPVVKPEWMEQRQQAVIKKLPPAQRAEAAKEMGERTAFFKSLEGLTPEERRAKFQEMMSNPDIQQKMEDRRLMRDSQLTSQQRVQRAVGYVARKEALKAAAANGGK